jgi:hypothetical protein
MMDKKKRVIMVKKAAAKWLLKNGNIEFRIRVYNPIRRNYPSLLRSFRDKKIKLAKADPIPDLGVQERSDGFEIWSSDVNSLRTLKEYFERRGMETSWIW